MCYLPKLNNFETTVLAYIVHNSDKITIIIILAPLSILSEDEWGDIERLYKACQQL